MVDSEREVFRFKKSKLMPRNLALIPGLDLDKIFGSHCDADCIRRFFGEIMKNPDDDLYKINLSDDFKRAVFLLGCDVFLRFLSKMHLTSELFFSLSKLQLLIGNFLSYKKARDLAVMSLFCDDAQRTHADVFWFESLASEYFGLELVHDVPFGCRFDPLKLYTGLVRYIADDSEHFDKKFYGFLKGKSVAVVGPCLTRENGTEIDGFDVVIRFNYRREIPFEASFFGSKTNVSYYISSEWKKYRKKFGGDFLNGLEFACGSKELVEAFPELAREHVFSLHKGIDHFVSGAPNAVQKCLIDIIPFQPSRIKLFNMDFFIDDLKQPGYRKGSGYSPAVFIAHDPLSNFLMIRRFFYSGLIEADVGVASILELDSESFCKKLHESHFCFY